MFDFHRCVSSGILCWGGGSEAGDEDSLTISVGELSGEQGGFKPLSSLG